MISGITANRGFLGEPLAREEGQKSPGKIEKAERKVRRSRADVGEILAQLQADAGWVALREGRGRWPDDVAENLRASAPVVSDLRRMGFDVLTVSDLFNRRLDYRRAIPVLLRWLSLIDNPPTKESIARALTDRAARPLAAPALIQEFRRAPDDADHFDLKWAVGNALSVVADDLVFDEIVELLRDKRHGAAREELTLALLNMKKPAHRAAAEELLIELLGETGEGDYTAARAMIALGKLRSSKAKPLIGPFLEHTQSWVRKEAQKALARIEKAEQKAREKAERAPS